MTIEVTERDDGSFEKIVKYLLAIQCPKKAGGFPPAFFMYPMEMIQSVCK